MGKAQATTDTHHTAIDVYIRWAIRRDLERIGEIEAACSAGEELAACRIIQDKRCMRVPFVAVVNDQIVGYMIYELNSKRIRLTQIAVDPAWRSRGIGTAMLNRVKLKLHPQRRDRIHVEVPVASVTALQFFLSQGFEPLFYVAGPTSVPDSHRLMRYVRTPQVVREELSRMSLWQRFVNFMFGCEHE